MMNEAQTQTMSEFLPPMARGMLMTAAQTSVDRDPLARLKAIDKATEKIRAIWPELFRPEAA